MIRLLSLQKVDTCGFQRTRTWEERDARNRGPGEYDEILSPGVRLQIRLHEPSACMGDRATPTHLSRVCPGRRTGVHRGKRRRKA